MFHSRRHPSRARAGILALVALVIAAASVSAQTNAVREAERFVTSRDFTAAARVLRAHLAREPGDLEAARLFAHTLYWAGDVAGARAAYEAALLRHPADPYLRIEFARMLIETGNGARARTLLVPLLDTPEVGAHACTLLGTLAYWDGDRTTAARLFAAALALDPAQADARRQLREIRLLTAPWVRVAPVSWHDDQPLDWQGATLEAGWFPAPLTSVRARIEPRRYGAAGGTIAIWLAEAAVRHEVPDARLDLELAGGAVQRTIDGTASTAWTGRAAAALRVPHHVTLGARVERRPYLYTTASLQTSIMASAAAAELRLNHPRGWLGQAAIERQRYPDDNTVRSAHAWLLAPVARTSGGHVQAGYAFSSEDAAESRFTLADAGTGLGGAYLPYYTPARVVKHAAIGAVAIAIAPHATLRLGGSYAIRATEDAPAFVQTEAGKTRVFERRAFTPWDGRASIDIAAGDSAVIALLGETGRGAFYQWARAGLQVTWRFTSGARRLSGTR